MIPRWFTIALLGAALAVAVPPARADGGDVIHFARSIRVDHDAEIDNAVCFFCTVQVDGTVTGDVVAVFGNIHITGDVQHDAVDIVGELKAEENASVEQDVIGVLGATRLGEHVIVGRNLVTYSGTVEMAPTAAVGNQRIDNPGWYLWIPLAFVLMIVFWVMRAYGAYRKRLIARGYKFHSNDDID